MAQFVNIEDKKPESKWAKVEDDEPTLEELSEKVIDANRYLGSVNADGYQLKDEDLKLIAASMSLSRLSGRLSELVYEGLLDDYDDLDEDDIMEALGQSLCCILKIAKYFDKDLDDVVEEAL